MSEGIIGAVAKGTLKSTAKPMAKNIVKNRVKQGAANTTIGQNIKNTYQDKKTGVLNKMKNISNDVNNNAELQALAPMTTDFIPSFHKNKKQYGNFTNYR